MCRNMRGWLGRSVGVVGALCVVHVALGSVVTSSVKVDWSTFKISGGTLGVDYALPTADPNPVPLGERASGAIAKATNSQFPANPNVNGPLVFSKADWPDVPAVSNTLTNAYGEGGITQGVLRVEGEATADGMVTTTANGGAYVFRNTDIQILGAKDSGTVELTFELNYQIQQELKRLFVGESASAYSVVNLQLWERIFVNDGVELQDLKLVTYQLAPWLAGDDLLATSAADDTLELTYELQRGHQYRIEGSIYTESVAGAPPANVIPEPGAGLLWSVLALLSGVAAQRPRWRASRSTA